MPRGRPKKKLTELNQIDGKLREDVAPPRAPRTLDEIMGIHETCRYKHSTAEEYELYLRDLNNTDLARECGVHGLIPGPDIFRLRKALLAEYNRYFKLRTGIAQSRTSIDDSNLSPDIRKILSEGR